MSNTIKITVPVEVEVDLDVWAETYGELADLEATARDARHHVPVITANAVHQAFQAYGNGAELIGDLYELVEV